MYRNFALATLLAAPLIVMVVQSVAPKPPEQAPSAAQPEAPPQPIPVPVPPPAVPTDTSAAVEPPSSFGQPMSDAGQPSLAPGTGLPDAPVSGSVSPLGAPAGSPNAEP